MARFKNVKLSLFWAIILASTSLIYFLLAYIGYEELNTNLSEVVRSESVVVDRGILTNNNRRGKSYDFYLDAQGLNRLTFRGKHDFHKKLLGNIHIGDEITVYHKKNSIVQIEKGKAILLSIDDYQKNSYVLIIIGLIAGFGTLIFVYWGYRKGRVK